MKLRETKTKYYHYFIDERHLYQGEYKAWYSNRQQHVLCHYKDGVLRGEYKAWYSNGQQSVMGHYRGGLHGEFKRWNSSGKLEMHTFDINGIEIIDFLENPELYPSTPEEKLMFVLKYGNGKFI